MNRLGHDLSPGSLPNSLFGTISVIRGTVICVRITKVDRLQRGCVGNIEWRKIEALFMALWATKEEIGEYTFYFAVDGNADGTPDATFMDSVDVTVE